MSNDSSTSGSNLEEVLLLRQEVASLRAELELERANSAERLAARDRVISLLEGAIQQCPVPVVIVTASDLAVKCRNRAALEVLGLPLASHDGASLERALEQKTWQDLRPDGTPKSNDELPVSRALRGQTTLGELAIVQRADGTRRWIYASAVPVHDDHGQVIAALVIFPDVTQRKEAEATVAATQERLELALDGADLGIWDWNVKSNTVSFDRRWAEMLGYASEELEPTVQTWERLVHPDDLARVFNNLKVHLQGQSPVIEFEHRLRHRDGSWLWILSKGRVCERAPDGSPQRIAGTHLNVTQRKVEELARQAAEREVRQRAEEVQSLLKSMTNSFVVWRTELDDLGELVNFYFEYFNDAYARVSGLVLEQVQGKSVREIWPETERSWFEVYGEVLRTGAPKYFEMWHEPTHGCYACHAYCPPNTTDRICVVFEDITERTQTVEKLEELAGQQRAILNAVPVGISFVKDRQFQWINPELTRMLGYTVEELQNAPTRILYVHQHDYDRLGREGYQHLASGAVYSTEILFKRKDNTSIWAHVTGQAVDAQAPEKGSIWTFHDITEQRLAEVALRESELRFKRLVQNSSDIIAVTDESGVFLSISDSATRILGYQTAELLGVNEFELVHPDDQESVTKFFDAITSSPDAPIRVEYRCQHRQGNWVALEVVGTNLLYDASVKGIVHNLRDVSERNRLSEQLQQAMKMEAVGRLAGGIAHDFNNLLTVISGSIELLRMDLEPMGSVPTLLHDAASAANSASALTRQLLAFSRRQMIEPRVLDLNELVRELHKLLTRVIGEDIALRTTLCPELGAVKVDPGQFEQVLVNLVVNARDAMPHGGALLVETSNIELDATYQKLHPEVQPGRYVLLTVSDTGIGMDASVKQRLFEPFFTTKPRGRGTGLGLATIFGAVKQAGGSIEVYSELGKGSTFKVYLPRIDATPESLERRQSLPSIAHGTETVLLVEDEERVRDLSLNVLQRLGYAVIAAGSASEALTVAQAHRDPIHLLMTDVVMPGINGRELALELAKSHPETKVLYASGYTENVIVHHGVVDERTHFIGKPYTVQGLASKIREILEGDGSELSISGLDSG